MASKRMNKEYYYPTQVCFTDLHDGENLNEIVRRDLDDGAGSETSVQRANDGQ
jgi:hypothetical protein